VKSAGAQKKRLPRASAARYKNLLLTLALLRARGGVPGALSVRIVAHCVRLRVRAAGWRRRGAATRARLRRVLLPPGGTP